MTRGEARAMTRGEARAVRRGEARAMTRGEARAVTRGEARARWLCPKQLEFGSAPSGAERVHTRIGNEHLDR